jgi:prepilin-type processing-associated H-X9-DG protein
MNRKHSSIREIVAVSIILIVLAAIVAPAVSDSIQQLQWKTCASNMAILAQAFQLYTNDNNGRYPQGGDLDGLRNGRTYKDMSGKVIRTVTPAQMPDGDWIWFDGTWTASGGFNYNNPPPPWTWRVNPSKGSIWRYTDKRAETYMCPTDIAASDPHGTVYGRFGLSFPLNASIITPDYGDYGGNTPAFTWEIADPSHVVLLAECGSPIVPTPGSSPVRVSAFDGAYRWWQYAPVPIHWGGANFAFCDGHVGWTSIYDWKHLAFYRKGHQ